MPDKDILLELEKANNTNTLFLDSVKITTEIWREIVK